MPPDVAASLSPGRGQRLAHSGLAWGFLGVISFSLTVPLTRIAVGSLDPLFIGAGRAVVAALLAIGALVLTHQRLPHGRQWGRLAVVAGGVVAGFPLLTSFALQTAPASHGAVIIGLLPAATAVVAVFRVEERPSRTFWIASLAGALAVIAFAIVTAGPLEGISPSDLLLLGAVACAAVGYAEGGVLSRELGSWQTISWALVVALPLMALLTGVSLSQGPPQGTPVAWLCFTYVSVVSMFLGFLAWYRGLAIGPIATVSQVQLAQPVMSIAWAALLVGETITMPTAFGALIVIACAGAAVRARVRRQVTTDVRSVRRRP